MIVWKLDDVMRSRGVKGRDLARRLAIGENYLSRVRHEVPDRLSLQLLDGLCRELGCSIGDLLEFRQTGRPRKPKIAPPVADEALLAAVAEALAAAEAEEAADGSPEPAAEPVVANAPAVAAEPSPAPEAQAPGATAVVRTGALQAKLDRLRRLKSGS